MTHILGILNVTPDSFSDGGAYLDPERALAHAHQLITDGADTVDIGAASSHPDSTPISPQTEISRLTPLLPQLTARGIPFSVDSYHPEVQHFALTAGATYLNDIHGFPDPSFYPTLAAASAQLIVMHSVQSAGNATREAIPPDTIVQRITDFFDARIAALLSAGIAQQRLILDPGLGFFLGTDPQCSIAALRALPLLKARYHLPILVGVSRKSFVQRLSHTTLSTSLPATLAAELYATHQGATYLRTHEPAPLRAALAMQHALI